jgi:DNA-binding beta-propeller fold protein YncE
MRTGMLARAILLATAAGLSLPAEAQPMEPPLALETKIPLGEVSGRIDHLTIDLKRQRLLIAELGNDSLGVVDLATGSLHRRIAGMSEPQGVAYVPFDDTIYVANAGDGSVRVLRGEDFAPLARIDLGDDPDNVRVDVQRRRVLVGYGKGALAVIDPITHAKAAELKLKGHPEGFQIDAAGERIFVNVPDARDIQAVDLATLASRSFPTGGLRANFPMVIDPGAKRIYVVFRAPPTLLALSTEGRIAGKVETCGDADDVFIDAKRRRVYVSCGEGAIDVFDDHDGRFARLARVATVTGARTALFVPELDRLFVAARANWNEPAAIWVFRPRG